MNKVLALVNLYSNHELAMVNVVRPLASTTIFGRYAFIDFTLSNISNSGINKTAIMVKSNANSIYKHLGSTSTYLNNSKTGILSLLINEKGLINPAYNTDINSIIENDYILYDESVDYVLVTNCHYVMKIDYHEVVEEHKKSGKLASLVYKKVDSVKEFQNSRKVIGDNLNQVQKIYRENYEGSANILLDTMVIDRIFFLEMIKKIRNISGIMTMDEFEEYIATAVTKVNLIEYKGDVELYDSMEKYYRYSMDLLNNKEKLSYYLDDDSWPFYTLTHNTRPVMYGEHANVSNSLISNGCTINGTVKNSILARDVLVEEGAVVENSIIFTHCTIRKGVHLKNVLADKRVEFSFKKEIIGEENNPTYFPRGEKI